MSSLAFEMLGLVLPFCRAFGESKVLVTCDKRNVASQRTIIKNGGVMENEIVDTVGLSKSGIIQSFCLKVLDFNIVSFSTISSLTYWEIAI